MTVHFIGAGPGAADLLTLRGRNLIAGCPVCLYAGSLIPEEILIHCPAGARIINTAPLDLDAIIAECKAATDAGQDVARLHSGDLSVWSAMGEQLRRLRAEQFRLHDPPHPQGGGARQDRSPVPTNAKSSTLHLKITKRASRTPGACLFLAN